jgi:hypothetical protein
LVGGRPGPRLVLGLILGALTVAALHLSLAVSGAIEASPSALRSRQGSQEQKNEPAKPATPQDTAQKQPALSSGSVRITADGTQAFKDSNADPSRICRLPQPSPEGSAPAWEPWAALRGPRIEVVSSEEDVPAYGATVPHGVAILLVNHREAKVVAKAGVRLTRGVYSVERLTYDLENPETSRRLERLESVVLGGTGVASKPAWLGPKSVSVYRFTNRSAQAASAFGNVKSRVRAIMDDHGTAARSMMVPLRECESNVGALSKGIQPQDRYARLKYIHRAILTASHAQALCQNQCKQGRLTGEEADLLQTAFDRLLEALTELSAGCLNLVPSMEVKRAQAENGQLWEVTVSMANAGKQPVTNVKIGTAAAQGATVRPAERAFFASVQPGETARASFTIRMPADTDDRLISADIAYFAARAPARLRITSIPPI